MIPGGKVDPKCFEKGDSICQMMSFFVYVYGAQEIATKKTMKGSHFFHVFYIFSLKYLFSACSDEQ